MNDFPPVHYHRFNELCFTLEIGKNNLIILYPCHNVDKLQYFYTQL